MSVRVISDECPRPMWRPSRRVQRNRSGRFMIRVSAMKLAGIDANLLAALDALLREKSVTRAARRLGVGQPAVSHALARLRDHFKDELLVLNGRDYVLTDKAEKLATVVANATRALSEVFEDKPSFDAATSSYRF